LRKYFYHLSLCPSIKNPLVIQTVIDRTKKVFDMPEIEILTPIGHLCQPKSIEQICYETTKGILDAAGSRKIAILWSGGIDSTMILSEFLKIAQHDQLIVLMNDNSILEYPDYYKKYIENKLETKTISFYNNNTLIECIKDGVVVSGQSMDNIFGESHAYHTIPQWKMEQTIPEFLTGLNSFSIEHYNKIISACPRPIKNVKDLFWWISYSLNYQIEQIWTLLEIEEMILNKNLFNYCDNSGWHDYAVSTPVDVKWGDYDYRNYKMPLKKQLYEFTKDEEYTKNKIKVHSWRNYRSIPDLVKKTPLFITTDWKREWHV